MNRFNIQHTGARLWEGECRFYGFKQCETQDILFNKHLGKLGYYYRSQFLFIHRKVLIKSRFLFNYSS